MIDPRNSTLKAGSSIVEFPSGPTALLSVVASVIIAYAIYNLFFHPLSDIPGPFWGRLSGIPSWYHASTGKRHLWLMKQFQKHGNTIRIEPNTVLFNDPEAYSDIYGMKSNVRRSPFYTAWRLNESDLTTLNTIDVAEHAVRRKLLSTCFTEKSLRAASSFIIGNIDRWNEVMLEESPAPAGEWSGSVDFSERLDALAFDIMGDLSFGRSFDIKEPGPNPLKTIPHNIAAYMKFYYPFCRSPFLQALIWLKPRGFNKLLELLSPPAVRQYRQFIKDNITQRITLYKQQSSSPEEVRRQDMFYFLCEARSPEDPTLGAYTEGQLRAESGLLIIAGSDTTAISLSGIFFYLTGNPEKYDKLVNEIRTTFASADDITLGPTLSACAYLRACVDEGVRLTPSGPCELPREVLPGGARVRGRVYPPGTVLGTVPWVSSRSRAAYGEDAGVFRPERWIVGGDDETTKESVAWMRSNFHPFAAGPGACLGKNLAMAEMMLTVARTLYRLDFRRAPGSGVGCDPGDGGQFVLEDAYISLRQGPEVQFRRRV